MHKLTDVLNEPAQFLLFQGNIHKDLSLIRQLKYLASSQKVPIYCILYIHVNHARSLLGILLQTTILVLPSIRAQTDCRLVQLLKLCLFFLLSRLSVHISHIPCLEALGRGRTKCVPSAGHSELLVS